MTKLIAAVVVVLPLWNDGATQLQGIEKALVEAEGRWAARKPAAYDMTVQVSCFCGALQKVPPRFRVTDGVAALVSALERPESKSSFDRIYGAFNTVPQMFASLRGYLIKQPYRMTVRYDPEFGFPVYADIDERQMVVDEEMSFRVTDFKPVTK